MNFTELYQKDQEYQKIIKNFETAKNELQRKANYGAYKYEALKEEGAKIHNQLTEAIREHNQTKVTKLTGLLDQLKSKNKETGYAERASEAKEMEMRYKLADTAELNDMVQHLKSDDLLELNLLRMELKGRGMDDLDGRVKNYVLRNKINGLSEAEQSEYDQGSSMLGTYKTMSDKAVVIDGQYNSLSNVNQELDNIAKSTDAQ